MGGLVQKSKLGAFGVLWCGVQKASMLDLALVSSKADEGGA